ncbi:MAG: SprB repeat-containing protein, partial [Candidatus Zixiibacteriota bacterium]
MLTVKYNFSLKPAIFILVLIFSLGLTVHEGVAQDTLHAGVPTNFGIEGDIWADMLQFGGLGAGIGTDDWFDNNPGAGIGVIDTNGGGAYYQLIQDGGSATNKLFKKGMAFPKNTVQHGKLLFDAVYVRDFNSAAGLSDSSQFTAGADKNADNPNGWTPGTGNVPQKNDIVDAFAHLRYDGPTDTDSLWLLLGLSRRVVQGDAHYDWELFRTADTIPPGGTVFPYTGPDGGHTAWRVVGGNLQPGDLIFSVDYTGGGKFPTPSVRLWVHRDSMAAIEAANPVIVFTGVATFDGTDAGPFGYAEIDIPDGAAYARVNGIETDPFPRKTLAPPWKTLEGSAAVQDSFVALQMSETAFNLNAMGLGEALFEDPCEKLFGWIFFKTRASQSFTAELKDFVGPYPFGEIVQVELGLSKTDVLCYGGSDGTITATWSGGTGPYMIDINGGGFVAATSPHLFSGLAAGSYQVIVKDVDDCPDTTNITVNQPTEVVLSLTKTDALCYGACDGSITATFSGGTPGYMIEIDGGGFVSATSTHLFSDLCAGSYEVVVKDANDCPDTANITVNQPTEVVLSLTKTDALCYQDCDGTITATFSGGTPGYMIEIDGGGFVSATSTHLFSDLCAGSYQVVVKDDNDCPDTAN